MQLLPPGPLKLDRWQRAGWLVSEHGRAKGNRNRSPLGGRSRIYNQGTLGSGSWMRRKVVQKIKKKLSIAMVTIMVNK